MINGVVKPPSKQSTSTGKKVLGARQDATESGHMAVDPLIGELVMVHDAHIVPRGLVEAVSPSP